MLKYSHVQEAQVDVREEEVIVLLVAAQASQEAQDVVHH
jgi:hypothetical protein